MDKFAMAIPVLVYINILAAYTVVFFAVFECAQIHRWLIFFHRFVFFNVLQSNYWCRAAKLR